MRRIERSMDYDDPVLAEIYDVEETAAEDIDLIRRLLPRSGPLEILECFSGTGRILIPLAEDGHRVTGIEISREMMDRARVKLDALGGAVRSRASMILGDVLTVDWGSGYDVVLLAGNCFYELPSPESQEECVRRAWSCLVGGGWVFIDTEDGSGRGADPSDVGTEWVGLEGTTRDGTYGRLSARVTDVDAGGVSHFVRTWYTRSASGAETSTRYEACKYPVSGREVEMWLSRCGFEIVGMYGDRAGTPCEEASAQRAIFWAKKS
jgi:SAM-dependent methyltransferase